MGELVELLKQAVADRLDDETGIVISGGIDSSTICCIAQQLVPKSLPTFTGYYDVSGFDERQFAQLVASSNHHWVEIKPQDVVDVFDEVARRAPEPIQGPGMIGQYIVARTASLYVDTVLSGEGGDELFGGYARLIKVAGGEMPPGYENYTPPADYPTTLEEALAYDYERLPDLLAVDDAMCAAFDLTAKAPFTDERVVGWAMKQNPADRVGKRILREEMQGIVPSPILHRREKMGFPIPLVKWAVQGGPLSEFFLDRIGYVPTLEDQYHRDWWYELVESARVGV